MYEILLKLIKFHSYIINDYKTETSKTNKHSTIKFKNRIDGKNSKSEVMKGGKAKGKYIKRRNSL